MGNGGRRRCKRRNVNHIKERYNEDKIIRLCSLGQISDAVATRASGTTWADKDEIGVSENRYGYTNVRYRRANGKFEPAGSIIFFEDDASTTFSAYYPYDSNGGTLTATTDATAQKNQPKIDFLYATGR